MSIITKTTFLNEREAPFCELRFMYFAIIMPEHFFTYIGLFEIWYEVISFGRYKIHFDWRIQKKCLWKKKLAFSGCVSKCLFLWFISEMALSCIRRNDSAKQQNTFIWKYSDTKVPLVPKSYRNTVLSQAIHIEAFSKTRKKVNFKSVKNKAWKN